MTSITPRPRAESRKSRAGHPLRLVFFLLPFVVLAALNSGGYRYGASDQAFYVPAVVKKLDPERFPRDGAVLGAQTRLTPVDDVIALVAGATGGRLPAVFAGLYVLALGLFALGGWQVGHRLFAHRWTPVALLAALSLRHAIARSGTNTLEGYFHPRMLAFALGALAVAAFLRSRLAVTVALLLVAGVVHPTTAVWFGAWLGAAVAIAHRSLRPWVVAAGAAAALAAVWALTAGPLTGRLVPLDPAWKQMLEEKDYLFPFEWPLYAWVFNLGYLPVIAWLYRMRVQAGLVDPLERGLALGSTVLLVIFAGALVFQQLGIAFAFQLQPARIFWMFDFLAVIYAVWALAEGAGANQPAERGRWPRPVVVAAIIATLSVARGVYVLHDADRPLLQISIPDNDWGRVMAWARDTPKNTHWLADPLHAVLYGTSVRVAGERDVLVEAVKDVAIGMYDRSVAARTDERLRAVGEFNDLTADDARRLAARYDLDYLVTEQILGLPVAFESGALRVYRLR